MQASATTGPSSNWFQPSWSRFFLAALLTLSGFLLPQDVPLEWYPLNNPGPDLNYLEISCAANVAGTVEIRYDLAMNGHRPIDTISWPISPTTQTYTYTFPLPDAPLVAMRVLPPLAGELTIRQMRIINRRNEEVRRFTRDQFRAEHDAAAISPSTEGWKLIAPPTGIAPSTHLEFPTPIIPVGQDHRNLLRCLLSTGYLTLMLWIILLAVLFVFHRPRDWRDFFAHGGFLALLAVLFATVGNRGLIRNSIQYARFFPPPVPPGLRLELDLTTSSPSHAQLFWDTGHGYSEAESLRQEYEPHQGLQVIRYNLPDQALRALRFDPRDKGEGQLVIRGIRVVDAGLRTRAVLPMDSLRPFHDIAGISTADNQLLVRTAEEATDPILEFTPEAVAQINNSPAPVSRPGL